jgi:hypothetical protein
MNNPTKWSLIGLGIFLLVVKVAIITFFISSEVISATIKGIGILNTYNLKLSKPRDRIALISATKHRGEYVF